jgi:hypothetical protein
VVNFTPWQLCPRRKSPGTHWIGGWVDPKPGLDDMEKTKFSIFFIFFNWYSGGGIQGPLGTAATNGLLCQPPVIMMMEKLME